MIKIDGLAEVVLNVRDASRAVAFYGNLLSL
jgi:catechol 2,3-dioxygenase-like lactoylglutathione lyase family enzyme